jgi:hypothetical protein
MIIEISFGLVGGLNFGLEKSLTLIKDILVKYPQATWRKFVDRNKGVGKYVVEIEYK